MGHQAFKTRYPNLYNMVRKMQATVAEVLQSDPLMCLSEGLWWG